MCTTSLSSLLCNLAGSHSFCWRKPPHTCFRGLLCRHGLGLGTDATMGFKDYIITLYNNNYTGVRDLYKYDAGNDYPCWDVLYQCSVGNTTKGTMDLLSRVGGRQAERGVGVSP